MAAYAFTFFEFRGKKFLFALVVGSMIIPAEMLMVQNYFTTAQLKLINTYLGMSIIFMVSSANIFLIRQQFKSFALAVREAALVDGCGNWRFFCRILIPMSRPVLATVFISSFVTTWNTYLWPLIVTNVNEMRTVQVIITMLNSSEINTAYGQVMAAAVLILIPSLVVFTLFQRRITEGMTAGAVKG
jgi:sn-glycerol 3-phosphate transport system permease protein